MTKLKALEALLEKVNAECFDPPDPFYPIWKYNDFMTAWEDAFGLSCLTGGNGFYAYKGSLNAAKALHDAVLPEWAWHVSSSGVAILDGPEFAMNVMGGRYAPARAWLIAILKALIAIEKEQADD